MIDLAMGTAPRSTAALGRVGPYEILAGDLHCHVKPPDSPWHVSRALVSDNPTGVSRMTITTSSKILVTGPRVADADRVLTSDALAFLGQLHREFSDRRLELLQRRAARWEELQSGSATLRFVDGPGGDWKVAATPADLNDRRVEITGPAERKMMINALNSGASVFMADFRKLARRRSLARAER